MTGASPQAVLDASDSKVLVPARHTRHMGRPVLKPVHAVVKQPQRGQLSTTPRRTIHGGGATPAILLHYDHLAHGAVLVATSGWNSWLVSLDPGTVGSRVLRGVAHSSVCAENASGAGGRGRSVERRDEIVQGDQLTARSDAVSRLDVTGGRAF